MDEDLTKDVSNRFKHAFGEDLTPFRAGNKRLPLYVGNKPAIPVGKDELSKEFVKALQASNVLLEKQGDGMRSFATVLLHVLAARTHSVQFLDEPEAFLHPPQAKLLGRYIAESKTSTTQLFIATHSTDVLEGLIEGGSEKVRIVRIRREGDVNKTRELDKEQTRSVTEDTLARFSRVFDGLFFEHVVICESDADCMFYQSLLGLQSISSDRRPDVLFIHAAGKHRMAKLAGMLRSLDVPVSAIVDLDILDNQGTFRDLFEKMRGNWDEVQPHWKAVHDHIVNKRHPLTADEVAKQVSKAIEGVSGDGNFPTETEREIKRILKDRSPWNSLKSSGRSALSHGEPVRQFDDLTEKCNLYRLWPVPVGELEGFCPSIGSHGPAFVEKVLEDRKLDSDPELEEARDFVAKIWRKAKVR